MKVWVLPLLANHYGYNDSAAFLFPGLLLNDSVGAPSFGKTLRLQRLCYISLSQGCYSVKVCELPLLAHLSRYNHSAAFLFSGLLLNDSVGASSCRRSLRIQQPTICHTRWQRSIQSFMPKLLLPQRLNPRPTTTLSATGATL